METIETIEKCYQHVQNELGKRWYSIDFAKAEKDKMDQLVTHFVSNGFQKISGNDVWDKNGNETSKGKSMYNKSYFIGITDDDVKDWFHIYIRNPKMFKWAMTQFKKD